MASIPAIVVTEPSSLLTMSLTPPQNADYPTRVYARAGELLNDVPELPYFSTPSANTTLPHILRVHEQDRAADASDAPRIGGTVWIVLWTRVPSPPYFRFDFLISITSSRIDSLPIFIYTPHTPSSLTLEFLEPRMEALASTLAALLEGDLRRVIAVFAPAEVSNVFARHWTLRTNVQRITAPFYRCILTTVTPQTFIRPHSLHEDRTRMRKAHISDLRPVTHLFQAHRAERSSRQMSDEQVAIEAQRYIREGVLFVYEWEHWDGRREIIALVGAARNALGHAFINKLYERHEWREYGISGRLIGAVCEHYFNDRYHTVSLYVDEAHVRASCIRLGFPGLNGSQRPEGAEEWLEIGFEGVGGIP